MHYFLILFSFFITAFGQPARIPFLGLLVAVFGFACFWQAMLAFSNKKLRFLIAALWFTAVQAVQLSWLATVEYMGSFIMVAYWTIILGAGLQFGLISIFVSKKLSVYQCLAIASAWVLCEGVRLFWVCGITWNPVGLALAGSSYSLQWASLFGVYGLSFWVIWVNLLLIKRQMTLWAVMAIFPFLFGLIYQIGVDKIVPISKQLEVALIHMNLSPNEKNFDVSPLVQWQRIADLLRSKKSVDLIVLPETAVPSNAHATRFDLEKIQTFFSEEFFPPLRFPYAGFYRGKWKVSNAFLAQTLANQYNARVIIGLDDRDRHGAFNAAFHYTPGNLHYERYEKQILAPIGEYIPLAWVEWFSDLMRDQFGTRSVYQSGKGGKIFHSIIPIGVSICLEETFTSIAREMRTLGAELFVSICNDSHFPNSKLGEQHFHHGRLRAVENGVPLLRSCNSGVTGLVDSFGRPLLILDSSKKADVLFASCPIRSHKTLYTFWGDWAIFGFSALCLFSCLIQLKKRAFTSCGC